MDPECCMSCAAESSDNRLGFSESLYVSASGPSWWYLFSAYRLQLPQVLLPFLIWTHKKRWRASKWTDKNGGHLLRRFSLSRQNRQLKCYGMVPFLLPATFFYASHGLIRFFV